MEGIGPGNPQEFFGVTKKPPEPEKEDNVEYLTDQVVQSIKDLPPNVP